MWIDHLIADGPVVTDGAWGTQLQAQGLPGGAVPRPVELVASRHRGAGAAAATSTAGSQIVLTNTFRANRISLASYDLADRVAAINREGVRDFSPGRRQDGPACLRSIGPTGKMLMAGEVSEDELRAAFAEQAAALAEAGAEALVIETMAELEEAELAVDAARRTGLPVVACVVFDSGANHDRTMMGVTPEQAAQRLTAAGADVVGANCGQGIAGYVDICRRMRAATDRPLWIKANAGHPGDRGWPGGLSHVARANSPPTVRPCWRREPSSSAAVAARRPPTSPLCARRFAHEIARASAAGHPPSARGSSADRRRRHAAVGHRRFDVSSTETATGTRTRPRASSTCTRCWPKSNCR